MNDFFGLLDKWRHFPAFPLEARSEVFFALFLPTVLESHFKKDGVKIKPQVIPQFPLKKEDNNQSNNVDFFALSDNGECAFLIELKTDMASISKEQACYLKRAMKKDVDETLADITKISQRSEQKEKYRHLLSALRELEADLPKLRIKPEVVYIQPRPCKKNKVDGFKYIYFAEFAEIVESQGDMGGLFAGYLRKWRENPAKSPPR
ncbi:MAG: hypothetical protein F4X57_07315 [Chloroflexi bacterium]|nr:hypothetical protein [Chloroflexota bacterium]